MSTPATPVAGSRTTPSVVPAVSGAVGGVEWRDDESIRPTTRPPRPRWARSGGNRDAHPGAGEEASPTPAPTVDAATADDGRARYRLLSVRTDPRDDTTTQTHDK